MNNKQQIKTKIKELNKRGYVKSINNNLSGIGNTLEKELGLSNNSFEIPDYLDYEIKARRSFSNSFITLFSSVPDGIFEIKRIKDNYGYPDKIIRNEKVLNGDVYGNKKNNIGINYLFQLYVDYTNEKIILNIYNKYGKLVDNLSFWSFDTIKEKLQRKVKKLALVDAWPKKINNDFYFNYYKVRFYELKDFNCFIKLIEKGIIKVTFRIGIYRSGPKFGQTHDHGSGFEIQEKNITKLFYSK